jgi:hypothetical protein
MKHRHKKHKDKGHQYPTPEQLKKLHKEMKVERTEGKASTKGVRRQYNRLLGDLLSLYTKKKADEKPVEKKGAKKNHPDKPPKPKAKAPTSSSSSSSESSSSSSESD